MDFYIFLPKFRGKNTSNIEICVLIMYNVFTTTQKGSNMVKDTDKGRELVRQIEDLKKLLKAYRIGMIKERVVH